MTTLQAPPRRPAIQHEPSDADITRRNMAAILGLIGAAAAAFSAQFLNGTPTASGISGDARTAAVVALFTASGLAFVGVILLFKARRLAAVVLGVATMMTLIVPILQAELGTIIAAVLATIGPLGTATLFAPPKPLGNRKWFAVGGIALLAMTGLWWRAGPSLPSFPSIAAKPDPSVQGTVTFFRDFFDRVCLYTVPGRGGDTDEVACFSSSFGRPTAVRWTTEGIEVALIMPDGSITASWINPLTGNEIRSESFEGTAWPPEGDLVRSSDGTRVEVTGKERTTRAGRIAARSQVILHGSDGTRETILAVYGPRDYGFTSARWSLDGRWLVVTDTSGRLLLISPTKQSEPRLLATDTQIAAWMP